MDRARAPGRRLPAGNQSRRPTRCRPPSARCRATGATGTAARATRASACTSARRSRPSGRTSPTPRSTTKTASSRSKSSAGVTVASVYVPNGGKDFPAKMRFLEALDDYARALPGRGRRRWSLCGDLNVARTDRDVHPKERKPRAIGQLPEERALLERIIGRGLVDVGRARRSRQRRAVHLVGAVAQHARSATSAGGSTTSWRARRWRRRPSRAPCRRTSARATTRRWWRHSRIRN